MVFLFLADGFEETEAIVPLDILRRAGLDLKTIAVGTEGPSVTASHGVSVLADTTERDLPSCAPEMVVLPGGMPGTTNLDASPVVHRVLEDAAARGARIGAICAAPMILGKMGLLRGRQAVCYPGFERYLAGAKPCGKDVGCVTDGNIVTARGAGVALSFAATLISCVLGEKKRGEVLASICADN